MSWGKDKPNDQLELVYLQFIYGKYIRYFALSIRLKVAGTSKRKGKERERDSLHSLFFFSCPQRPEERERKDHLIDHGYNEKRKRKIFTFALLQLCHLEAFDIQCDSEILSSTSNSERVKFRVDIRTSIFPRALSFPISCRFCCHTRLMWTNLNVTAVNRFYHSANFSSFKFLYLDSLLTLLLFNNCPSPLSLGVPKAIST